MTSADSRWDVELYGAGRVGSALAGLLPRDGLRIGSIRDRSGVRYEADGDRGRTVVVDATAPRYDADGASAWAARLESCLVAGIPVVTCNKAPLATAWVRIAGAARRGGTTVACTATVGGGTPVLPILSRLHRSIGIRHVEGELNATLGYVCDRVARGERLREAIRAAQAAGWAEPDPSLDLDGTDLLAKAVIVHNVLFRDQDALRLDLGNRPLTLTEQELRSLGRPGRPARVVARVEPGRATVSVEPPARGNTSGEAGSAVAAVRAVLADGSEVALRGPGAGAQVTAAALLGDLRSLVDAGRPSSGVIA